MEIIDINSPEATSKDVVAENVRQLGELFPELLAEGPLGPSINVDVLKQLVGEATVSEIDEKYGLSWFGKRNARKMALTPSLGTLLPRPDESEDWDSTKNLMIEGDNLEVLKLLQKSYSGKVKLIYIDPPYNTGKDFVYPDNYQDNIKNYLELTGQTEEGRKTTSNTESSGRFHTDWLNMMYPRLVLARNLLADDGVLLISLDDTELNRLITMLEEIFGEQNYVANFIWRKKYSLSFMADEFISIHENIICVRKKDILSPVDRRWIDQTTIAVKPVFKSQNQRSTKIFRAGCKSKAGTDFIIKKGTHSLPSQDLEFLDSATFVDGVLKDDVRVVGNFAVGQDTLDTHFEEIEVSPSGAAYFKSDATESSIAPLSILFDYTKDEKDELYEAYRHRKSISTRQATSEVEDLLGRKVFDNPKPVALIRYLVETMIPDLEAVILDFFAGSGTTGQAVMEQNALDGGNRQFILVQLPEPLLEENKEQAEALAFCKEHNLEENIAALTAERLRRAGAKVRSENPMFAGDVGFRVFKLAESNIRAWNPLAEDLEGTLRTSEDHLVEGRSELDVLYEILLKRGLDLCIPIETKEIASHHVIAVGGGVLFACLDSHIAQATVEALAEGIAAWREELGVVGDVNCIFRDSAFGNDVAKSNMSSILEQAGFTKIQSL
jgi:adenine-specific DNA-methyltransferase